MNGLVINKIHTHAHTRLLSCGIFVSCMLRIVTNKKRDKILRSEKKHIDHIDKNSCVPHVIISYGFVLIHI